MTDLILIPVERSQPLTPLKQGDKKFYHVPDGIASNFILETLGAGENIADLPVRKRQVNHNTAYQVLEDGKRRQIVMSNNKASVIIELADIEKISGSNKPTKKLFILTLMKANEQSIFNGVLTKDYISFPLQELLDIGFYNTPQSARKGFKDGMDVLTSLKIKGRIEASKSQDGSSVDVLEVLYTGASIKNGQCTVYFNSRINWNFIVQFYTILPRYYFRLSNRASDLLYYIFFLARQHTKDIAEKSYFTIGFRAIQHRLQLPSEVRNTRPQQTIKQPIEEAVAELEEQHAALYGNAEFLLEPVYDASAGIRAFLDNGYLKITLTGEFARNYIMLNQQFLHK